MFFCSNTILLRTQLGTDWSIGGSEALFVGPGTKHTPFDSISLEYPQWIRLLGSWIL